MSKRRALRRARTRAGASVACAVVACVAAGAILGAAPWASAAVRAMSGGATAARPQALWGVDSTDPITPQFLDAIGSALGTPQFFGRYVGGRYALTAAEVDLAFSRGIPLLLIDQAGGGTANETGYATGQADAAGAIDAATALGAPRGVVIFRDVETSSAVDADFVRGYVDQMSNSPYLPGFYGNTANGAFSSAYCGAAALGPSYAAAYVFSAVYEPGRGPLGAAPLFAPVPPPCAARTVAWQYGEPDGDALTGYCRATVTCPNVDTDQALASLPFWSRDPAADAPLLFNGGFEDGTSGWTVAGNTTLAVLGRDAGAPKRGAAFVRASTSSRPGAFSQTIPVRVTPGQAYTFSMWVRSARPGRAPFRGSLVLFGLGGTTEAATVDFTAGGDWTLVSVTFTPAAAHDDLLAAVYLRTRSGGLDADAASVVVANRGPATRSAAPPTDGPTRHRAKA